MAEPKGYMKDLSAEIKVWRWSADIAIFLACTAALLTTVPFALFPKALYSESQIAPTADSRAMAWIMMIITVVLVTVILRLRFQFTRDSLRSEQKVELWGGATGLFVLFTMGDHVSDDARNGLMGALGLILLLAAAVLLEPLALYLRERGESERSAQEEDRHKEFLAALASMKVLSPPSSAEKSAKTRRQIFGIRLG